MGSLLEMSLWDCALCFKAKIKQIDCCIAVQARKAISPRRFLRFRINRGMHMESWKKNIPKSARVRAAQPFNQISKILQPTRSKTKIEVCFYSADAVWSTLASPVEPWIQAHSKVISNISRRLTGIDIHPPTHRKSFYRYGMGVVIGETHL